MNPEPHPATIASPWLTVDQAAARAQLGTKAIYRAVRSGRLRAARVGGRRQLRFRSEWIDAWLEATAIAPASPPTLITRVPPTAA